MAGYSKTPLHAKLGITRDSLAAVINPPQNYEQLIGFPIQSKLAQNMEFIQFFTNDKEELEKRIDVFKKSIAQNGIIWISWPKTSSKMATNLNENVIRDLGLEIGLVDVKVAAIDEIWSGLKFVISVKKRK